jgi:hypothetical protein
MSQEQALAALVAGEDAAIYAYSVAGARVANAGRRRALAALDSHRANRDRAASLVVAAGGTPPGAAVAYTLPGPVDSPAAARSLMAEVDNRLVGLYADAAAELTGADRRWAVRTAAVCATRAVTLGADSQAFPVGTGTPPVIPATPSTAPSSANGQATRTSASSSTPATPSAATSAPASAVPSAAVSAASSGSTQ